MCLLAGGGWESASQLCGCKPWGQIGGQSQIRGGGEKPCRQGLPLQPYPMKSSCSGQTLEDTLWKGTRWSD